MLTQDGVGNGKSIIIIKLYCQLNIENITPMLISILRILCTD